MLRSDAVNGGRFGVAVALLPMDGMSRRNICVLPHA
jgi:hypothetical protein